MRTALLSVTDKGGLVPFATGLVERDFRLLSTGGTARVLREAGLPVTDVSEMTGFPEMLDGRVKTLHPKVHGGLLGRRDLDEHRAAMDAHDIAPIDLVAVNLYAFRETVAKPDVTPDQAVEQIDIGGPSMLRSAAKNHASVWVVVDPGDYDDVLAKLDAEGEGDTASGLERRRHLAAKAYRTTAAYDAAISSWFSQQLEQPLPESWVLEGGAGTALRYGENPHQAAAVYRHTGVSEACVAHAEQLAGKALSYNNLMDADAAFELVKELPGCAAAVIKHTNPCGAGTADTLTAAIDRAFEGDPQSAFGGIVALNQRVDAAAAEAIATEDRFLEVVVAPAFDEDAVEVLTTRRKWGRNVRLLACGDIGEPDAHEPTVRKITGGVLVQQRDLGWEREARDVKTQRAPTDAEATDLELAWRVCKHVKSNAIVLVREGRVVGVGAGQMSRVDSVEIAGRKAGDRSQGAVLASDAFFPFRDSIDTAHGMGVTAVVQPGGSIKDKDSIAAADEHGLAMWFTGTRHFRH